jgi:hypothetical protein
MCFCCNSTYGKYGEIKNGCTMKCVGNVQQTCGNSLVNSIYKTMIGKS